jgi:hypothetical protein
MTKDKIESAIDAALEQRKTKVLNRNAIKALLGCFSNPVDALGQVFLGRTDAVNAERQRLEQEAILDLVCRIDAGISTALDKLKAGSASPVLIQGLIETLAINAEVVTGVDVTAGAGPVEFKPGTRIRTTGSGVRSLTGLRIGGQTEGSK